jgi:hypothetical protein
MALPALLMTPVEEDAVIVPAACFDWQCMAVGGFWAGGGLVPGLWPGGGGFALIFDRGGAALMWRGGREFV